MSNILINHYSRQRRFREKHPNYDKEWQREHPEFHREYQKTYAQRHPEIIKAQDLAKYHIPLGLKCKSCGSTENLERHHPDYSKPLEIITLCRICHNKLDRSD